MRIINDQLHEDFILPNESRCPHCSASFNTGSSKEQQVLEGDYGICADCAEICIVMLHDGVICMRKPTPDEIEAAKQHGVFEQLEEYKKLILSGNSGLKCKKE